MVLKRVAVCFLLLVCTIVVGGMAIGIVEPTLAPYLKDQVIYFFIK